MLHIARCPLHTPHPPHSPQHSALTAPAAMHPNRRRLLRSRCQAAAASCCQAVGAPLLGPLGNVATCNWQLPPPFADDGRRTTGDGLFSLPLWHWQLTARAACNLFDLPLLAKQPQFCNPLPLSLSLFPPLSLAPLTSFRVAPFTVSPQMSVAQKKIRLLNANFVCRPNCTVTLCDSLSLSLFRTLASRFGTVYA